MGYVFGFLSPWSVFLSNYEIEARLGKILAEFSIGHIELRLCLSKGRVSSCWLMGNDRTGANEGENYPRFLCHVFAYLEDLEFFS